eukprot:COSAG02_NODE_4483_length_5304_cov_2.651297_4_plen_116_part_00
MLFTVALVKLAMIVAESRPWAKIDWVICMNRTRHCQWHWGIAYCPHSPVRWTRAFHWKIAPPICLEKIARDRLGADRKLDWDFIEHKRREIRGAELYQFLAHFRVTQDSSVCTLC